jgi:hypothetical protein
VEKTCKGCTKSLPLAEFYENEGMRDGRLNWCKPCVIARHVVAKRRRQSELLAYIQAIKMARGCADCGYRDHPAALDFDHLPGSVKKMRLATAAAGATLLRIQEEIAKCDVVCANCHRIRTANRRQQREASAS